MGAILLVVDHINIHGKTLPAYWSQKLISKLGPIELFIISFLAESFSWLLFLKENWSDSKRGDSNCKMKWNESKLKRQIILNTDNSKWLKYLVKIQKVKSKLIIIQIFI